MIVIGMNIDFLFETTSYRNKFECKKKFASVYFLYHATFATYILHILQSGFVLKIELIIFDKVVEAKAQLSCAVLRLVAVFGLIPPPPTTTTTTLTQPGCFSAPCGPIWACEDIFS